MTALRTSAGTPWPAVSSRWLDDAGLPGYAPTRKAALLQAAALATFDVATGIPIESIHLRDLAPAGVGSERTGAPHRWLVTLSWKGTRVDQLQRARAALNQSPHYVLRAAGSAYAGRLACGAVTPSLALREVRTADGQLADEACAYASGLRLSQTQVGIALDAVVRQVMRTNVVVPASLCAAFGKQGSVRLREAVIAPILAQVVRKDWSRLFAAALAAAASP